jgi:hypothetical protein
MLISSNNSSAKTLALFCAKAVLLENRAKRRDSIRIVLLFLIMVFPSLKTTIDLALL